MTASEVDVETGEEGEVGMEETETVEEEEEEEVILILGVAPSRKCSSAVETPWTKFIIV